MAELKSIDGNRNLPSHRRSDLYGTTPPETANPYPLTPPATDERHRLASDSSAVDAVVRIIEACRDRTATKAHTPFSEHRVARKQYSQLLELLQRNPSLGNYVNDKVRYGVPLSIASAWC